MIYAVAGKPVIHSKSPIIFNTFFRKAQMDSHYIRFAAENIDEIAILLKKFALAGFNVTAPFKEDVISELDSVEEEARFLRSVNTVVNRAGSLQGYSTDSYGVSLSLEPYLSDLEKPQALLLGAGGAARAAAYALYRMGIAFTVVNRTHAKAVSLAKSFDASSVEIEHCEKAVRGANLIINTMLPEAEIVKSEWIQDGAICLDAIYKKSQFQNAVANSNARLIRGEEWLFNQADQAAHHFFNAKLREHISASDIQNSCNFHSDKICLIGFMGSGKSTVGESLADKFGRRLIDIDSEIIEREQMEIGAIFQTKGEQYFRSLEKEMLNTFLASEEKLIISCGGGVVSGSENRDTIKKHGLAVWILADIEESFKRVQEGDRPLALGGFENFKNLFDSRLNFYAELAELCILNSNKSAEETAQRLYDEISTII